MKNLNFVFAAIIGLTVLLMGCRDTDFDLYDFSCGGVYCDMLSGWNQSRCVDDVCKAISCDNGYYLYEERCEPNSIHSCGSYDNNCEKILGWSTGMCSWEGECLIIECIEGFVVEDNLCVPDSTEACTKNGLTCERQMPGADRIYCAENECQALTCHPGWRKFRNECVPDTNECCGNTCIQCSNGTMCSEGVCVNTCTPALTQCDNACVNLSNNNEHCGACHNPCNPASLKDAVDAVCVNSTCVASACKPSYHLTEGASCAPDSLHHCGSESNDCTLSDGWVDGSCKNAECRATACAKGWHLYDNGKTSICEKDTDENCLQHGNLCMGGSVCSQAGCVCPYGTDNCGTDKNPYCVDLTSDNDNCNACGHACLYSQRCSLSRCLGPTNCNGIVYDTETSVEACGGCNSRCDDGLICSYGFCISGIGNVYCNDVIVNTRDDSYNCGQCGYECGADEHCSEGNCVYNVRPGYDYCPNSGETDLDTDPDNCGSCGVVCGIWEECQNGYCVDTSLSTVYCGIGIDPLTDASNCGECNHYCDLGERCEDGRCVDNFIGSTIYCFGQAIDPDHDSANCGGCDNYCDSGKYCLFGSCSSLPWISESTTITCSGNTVYPYSDPDNCGGCAIECGIGEYCDEGQCYD